VPLNVLDYSMASSEITAR